MQCVSKDTDRTEHSSEIQIPHAPAQPALLTAAAVGWGEIKRAFDEQPLLELIEGRERNRERYT